MKLTKEQAITEHRKMWNWIADQYKNKTDFLNKTDDINDLKQCYINMVFPGEVIECDCFCCEYDYEFGGICENCPIEWDSIYDEFMCTDKDSHNNNLYGLLCNFDHNECSDNIFSYCADLARQIANLPERKW